MESEMTKTEALRLMVQCPELTEKIPEGIVARIIESYDELVELSTDYMLFGKICRDMAVPVAFFKRTKAPACLSPKGLLKTSEDPGDRTKTTCCLAVWIDALEFDGPVDPYRLEPWTASTMELNCLGVTVGEYFGEGDQNLMKCSFDDLLRYRYPKPVDGSNALDGKYAKVGVLFDSSVHINVPGDPAGDTVDCVDSGMVALGFLKERSDAVRDSYERNLLISANAAIEFLKYNGFSTEFDPNEDLYGVVLSRDATRPPELR